MRSQVGSYIAFVNATNIPMTFASGAVESVLLARGVAQRTIRKWSTILGSVVMGGAAAGYGFTQSPGRATAWYIVYMLGRQSHNGGIGPNCELGAFSACLRQCHI